MVKCDQNSRQFVWTLEQSLALDPEMELQHQAQPLNTDDTALLQGSHLQQVKDSGEFVGDRPRR